MNNHPESKEIILQQLPGLDCGLCGSRTCVNFAEILQEKPNELTKCIHLGKETVKPIIEKPMEAGFSCQTCKEGMMDIPLTWKDSLGRDYDFILDSLPGDLGPREIIIPHNPSRTKDLDIQKGDTLIGRPMGMSCGCPITHCGVAKEVDPVNGVITWCVTGPLNPRTKGFKDVGYYSAQAYEGVVTASQSELKIGMRYFFMPHRCMLQWRHSGLVNFINKFNDHLFIRLEGLFIG
ncbi:MAG: (Fe-S)-binding protein [Thermodesulfobacteriota bacterium]|jgi:uncharacterized Fe-S cluster-containing protein